ncbi:MAG: D-alanyl-D-alanine carboxypeptidase family protein [Clostridium sp.]|nr:D-alanyl-D-alanine carboxypeptidase family protein [Clostridium sp.]
MENNGTDTSQLPSRDEVVTTPDSIFCLVNKEYSLPSNYEPNDLVVPNIAFSIDYESEKKYLRKVAAEALEQLFADAAKEELEIVAVSGYRSYTRQKEIYENNLKTRGTTHTNQYSAKPGYSEHQTGLVMDVSCKSEHFALRESFAETPEGIWLAENASKYGFIIRYPEGKSDITGYAYEPWHIRYVGVPMATYLVDNNLTLDEYFHYEPSYTFITDESAYINDTPENDTNTYNYSSAPSTTVAPTTTTNANQSGSTTQQKPSKVPVASKAPVTTTQAPTVTPEVTTQVPVEETVAPTEESTPTPAPSIEPSNAPSVAPSTVAPSKPPSTVAPPPENTDDVVTEAEGSLEES